MGKSWEIRCLPSAELKQDSPLEDAAEDADAATDEKSIETRSLPSLDYSIETRSLPSKSEAQAQEAAENGGLLNDLQPGPPHVEASQIKDDDYCERRLSRKQMTTSD